MIGEICVAYIALLCTTKKARLNMRSIVQLGSKPIGILTRPTATLQIENKPLIQRLATMLINELKGRKNIAMGIALNQLGSPYNGFIAKIDSHPKLFFNAVIVKTSDSMTTLPEQCLSVKKGKEAHNVIRWDEITVNYYDFTTGRVVSEEFSDDNARVIQHEIDHCSGITIRDSHEQKDSYHISGDKMPINPIWKGER